MTPARRLRVLFDESCGPTFREAFDPVHFETVASGDEPDAVIFERDDFRYIRKSPLFARWPEKSLIISESDAPGFFLPGIYAANHRHFLSRGRARTCCYFVAQRFFPNPDLIAERDAAPAKQYLLAFVGGSTSWVRKKLFRLASQLVSDDVLIRDTNNYYHWDTSAGNRAEKERLRREYAAILARSRFFLCPRGAGHSSVRLFETMAMGVCPVIVADGYIPPEGPDWDRCALFVRESDIARVVEIARRHAGEAEERGRRAREAYEAFFSEPQHGAMLARLIGELMAERNEARERWLRRFYPLYQSGREMGWWLRGQARRLVLGFFRLLRLRFPYQLNRPLDPR